MAKRVKGTLFVEYVRMIRSRKDVDWSGHLKPKDMKFLKSRIVDTDWYPFDTFERMGLAIIDKIAGGDMDLVRMWGRGSVEDLTNIHGSLVCVNDPLESLMRFQVLRGGFFDFSPINVKFVSENFARLEILYGMSRLAEEAATYQALGYFERLLELSGAADVRHQFKEKAWEGAKYTVLELEWGMSHAERKVKGVLFLDYVRMIKSRKDIDWSRHLKPEDMVYLKERINDKEWYPFDTFERMGLGIIKEMAGGSMEAVRLWGYNSIDELLKTNKGLLNESDPRESLMRFQVLRRSFFDFGAIYIQTLLENYARVEISYDMSGLAEEAATYQAVGFFHRLLELSGAKDIKYRFKDKMWEGAGSTILELRWS